MGLTTSNCPHVARTNRIALQKRQRTRTCISYEGLRWQERSLMPLSTDCDAKRYPAIDSQRSATAGGSLEPVYVSWLPSRRIWSTGNKVISLVLLESVADFLNAFRLLENAAWILQWRWISTTQKMNFILGPIVCWINSLLRIPLAKKNFRTSLERFYLKTLRMPVWIERYELVPDDCILCTAIISEIVQTWSIIPPRSLSIDISRYIDFRICITPVICVHVFRDKTIFRVSS